jgi:uncharacterized membrane protein
MKSNQPQQVSKWMPWILTVCGSIGLLSAFILTLEKIALLKDASFKPICNLNPVFSCSSIITTDQASAFGFPNPLIGIIGFSVVITIGMGIFARAKFARWFWLGLNIASSLAVVFVHWLIFESLYDINALCLFCIIVWSITMPIWWYTTIYNIQNKNIIVPKKLQATSSFIQKHHLDILITWYVILIALILQNFWYYWKTIF